MKKCTLIVKSGFITYYQDFYTITDAYTFYLKNYATYRDYLYYLCCAHRLLNRVQDEHIMECIFRNVFDENVELVLDSKR